jgi:hypothetical protein
MRVVVFGSNKWDDEDLIRDRLAGLPRAGLMVVHGDGQGVSAVVGEWAEENAVPHIMVPTDWSTGRRAALTRNAAMLDHAPELAIAFRTEGRSSGIDAVIALCRKRGVRVEVVREVPLNEQVALLKQVIADALRAVEAGAPRDECLRILRNGFDPTGGK